MSLYLQVVSTVMLVDLQVESLLRGLLTFAVSLLEVLPAQSVIWWPVESKGTEMSLCQMHFVVIF